jgi:peptidoglycan/LPS O-acetylase OafA/YrhL
MMCHLTTIRAWPNAALVGFYALSGYSITARGTGGDYWQGRLLRLWPIYLVIAAATQMALWLGWVPRLPYIALAQGMSAIWQALMIVPTWPDDSLVPVAWMLQWILLGYGLMWLGWLKTPRQSAISTLGLFLVSIYALSLVPDDFQRYYTSGLCALTAMSIGACGWHLGLTAPRDDSKSAFAGSLSYPVFLLHYNVAAAISSQFGWPLFFAALPPTLALSWLLVVAVERPVQKFRSSFRGKSNVWPI